MKLTPSILLLSAALALTAGCGNKHKISEQKAVDELAKLLPTIDEDVRQVREGLPKGATKLATHLETSPTTTSLPALQRAIQWTRSAVPDLDVAKSTFFSLTDPFGIVLRSEADPDLLAQRSIIEAFPVLKKVLDPASSNVEAFGEMDELRGVRKGNDVAWVVAHPVQDAAGALKGVFVTGWSFRRYAYRLEQQAKHDLLEAAEKSDEKNVPLVYVFVLRGAKAYGAPVTPDVNAEAIEQLDPLAKAAAGTWRGQLDITGRRFGVAVARTPKLAEDTGVAVILSQF
jgi:hypothetical protein